MFHIAYGIDAFYLPKIAVAGTVIQEKLFTNLAYQYNVTHLPVFAALKASINHPVKPLALTFDAGIGPNVITTAGFHERPLDSMTQPDNLFSGHTSAAFSAMAGVGVKINNAFGHAPLECGYRFLYLGQGQLKTDSNQLTNSLKTGQVYANALLCSLTV